MGVVGCLGGQAWLRSGFGMPNKLACVVFVQFYTIIAEINTYANPKRSCSRVGSRANRHHLCSLAPTSAYLLCRLIGKGLNIYCL
jgi:hypothetical protein